MIKATLYNILDECVTLKNTFVGNGYCVYQWVTMKKMENDKNHTVEHIRWVSYTKKHILWIRELCIYQWVTMRNMENVKNHTVEHIRWVSYTEKHIRWKRELCISMSYNEKHEKV